jgi:hypothetical protein
MQNFLLVVVWQIFFANSLPVSAGFKPQKAFYGLKSTATEWQNTNPTYRKFNKQSYLILEIGKIVIYQRNIHLQKSMQTQAMYYFSLTTDSDIFPLTLHDLQAAFQKNAKVYQTLELRFAGREEDLILYDHIHKTYKVNYWLAQ